MPDSNAILPPAAVVQGRGAASNPPNRFEALHLEWDPDTEDGEAHPGPRTQFFHDRSSSILTFNDSPDIGFDASINPYRGCEHGCVYCYARPTHEFLGLSSGLDFESKIMVKDRAPELLRKELAAAKWKPVSLAMSSVTDCYQPVERKLQLTRRCLEVLAECRQPVGLITKNFLVTRDIDLLRELDRFHAVSVTLSITTLDADLARTLEPRTSSPRQRLAAIEALASAGIPVGVNAAPMIPGLTDHEMLSIIEAAAHAGAAFAGYTVVRLPYALKDLFIQWLDLHAPGKKDKILNRIRSMRDGKLNESNFGARMRGQGIFADQIRQTFEVACRKAGLKERQYPTLSSAAFRKPSGPQMELGLA